MVEVVGVRFREAGHIYYFAPGKSEYIYNEKYSLNLNSQNN